MTVQENKSVLHQVNSLTCTPKNNNHLRSQYIRPGKQILPKQNNPVANVHHLYFIRFFFFFFNMFIDNHIKKLHLQNKKKNTLTRDINRVKQKKIVKLLQGVLQG